MAVEKVRFELLFCHGSGRVCAVNNKTSLTNVQLISRLFSIAAAWEEKSRTSRSTYERDFARNQACSLASKAELMLANPAQYPLTAAVINVG